MAKKIKKLEKETAMYRERWENSNKALLSMAEEVSESTPIHSTVYHLHTKYYSLLLIYCTGLCMVKSIDQSDVF